MTKRIRWDERKIQATYEGNRLRLCVLDVGEYIKRVKKQTCKSGLIKAGQPRQFAELVMLGDTHILRSMKL